MLMTMLASYYADSMVRCAVSLILMLLLQVIADHPFVNGSSNGDIDTDDAIKIVGRHHK
jgi:hypothetical protein